MIAGALDGIIRPTCIAVGGVIGWLILASPGVGPLSGLLLKLPVLDKLDRGLVQGSVYLLIVLVAAGIGGWIGQAVGFLWR